MRSFDTDYNNTMAVVAIVLAIDHYNLTFWQELLVIVAIIFAVGMFTHGYRALRRWLAQF